MVCKEIFMETTTIKSVVVTPFDVHSDIKHKKAVRILDELVDKMDIWTISWLPKERGRREQASRRS